MRPQTSIHLVALVTFFLTAGTVQAAEWRVAKIFGDAWIEMDGVQKVSLTAGFEPDRSATIHTGSDGKVFLVRGRETMIVGARSTVRLPADRGDGWTTIEQKSGVVTYDVEKRNVRHFEVRTPTIVAVVKGTRFKVTQNRYGSKVTVTRGLVEVSDTVTGDTTLVPAGQKAILDRGKRGRLRVVGPGEKAGIIRKADASSDAKSGNAANGSSNSGASTSASSNSGNGNSGNSENGNGNSGNGNSGNGNGNSGNGNAGNGNGNSGNGNSGNGRGNSSDPSSPV